MPLLTSLDPAPDTDQDTAQSLRLVFRNSYARLPERFFARVVPVPVSAPRLIRLNVPLAEDLGFDPAALAGTEGVQVLAGNRVPRGSEPMAIAYAGHQFGHFVPQLGDGRANLLGEVVARDGKGYDLQLKGSGPTPFSRRGDGRAALGPVLREYVLSEAMSALGVPTTRALSAVLTGETVLRESRLPGAVLCRVAASHVRVGTFQYFAARGDIEALRTLARYVLERHYPELAGDAKPYRALLEAVIRRQARLIARWMLLGFIHGVMNTDNMSISGETIDYGPCAFLEAYEPEKVYSSIDMQGRYAYSNQPHAAHWNLTRLAEAMLPLLLEEEGGEEAAVESAQAALRQFAPEYDAARLNGFRHKLGLDTAEAGDEALLADLLTRMSGNGADFTLVFRGLAEAAEGDDAVRELFADPAAFDAWAVLWRARLSAEDGFGRAGRMRMASPAFIPRSHLVEEVIRAGTQGDFAPFSELLDVVTRPYSEQPGNERFRAAAHPEQCVAQTFCGT